MRKITDLKAYLSDIKGGAEVYEFLSSVDENTPKGRRDFNENVYVNVISYETKDCFDEVFESHKEYVDVHAMICGKEKIYYGDGRDMTVRKEYDCTGDYELLKGNKYRAVEYGEMQGVEFETDEPHMAGFACSGKQKIIKAVIKIKK